MSALKNTALAGFVVISIAGSIACWKERCDTRALAEYLEVDDTTALLQRKVDTLQRENESLAAQLEVAHRSRAGGMASR